MRSLLKIETVAIIWRSGDLLNQASRSLEMYWIHRIQELNRNQLNQHIRLIAEEQSSFRSASQATLEITPGLRLFGFELELGVVREQYVVLP